LLSAGAAGADGRGAVGGGRARATTAEQARDALHESIAAAVDAGYSLRQVGAAAGLSHERVRQVLRESRQEI
jgi:hypothetical protein